MLIFFLIVAQSEDTRSMETRRRRVRKVLLCSLAALFIFRQRSYINRLTGHFTIQIRMHGNAAQLWCIIFISAEGINGLSSPLPSRVHNIVLARAAPENFKKYFILTSLLSLSVRTCEMDGPFLL